VDRGGHTLFFTGYARLPAGITASEMYRVVGVGLEVDARSGEIVDVEATLATSVGRRFFRRLVKGRRLLEDFPEIVAAIEQRYHGNAQKALVTALRIAHEKYRSYLSREDSN